MKNLFSFRDREGASTELAMEQLPDDVIEEIFSFLPLKTAIISKCLSTRFNKIISEQSFSIKLSNRLKLSNKTILFNHSSYERPVFIQKIAPPNCSSYVKLSPVPNIYASCDGLLLLGYRTSYGEVFCVCNPITKNYQFITLNLAPYSVLVHAGLAIDLNNHESLFSPKYKVVAICWSRDGVVFHTFKAENHTWAETLVPKGNRDLQGFENGTKAVYANGHLHWLQEDGDIVAFDVEKEKARVIKGPPNLPNLESRYNLVFGEYQGKVRIVSGKDTKYVMHTLHDYERENWTAGSSVEDSYFPVLFRGERFISRKRFRRDIYSCAGNDIKHPQMIGTLISFMDGCQSYNFFDPSLAKVSPIDYIDDSDEIVDYMDYNYEMVDRSRGIKRRLIADKLHEIKESIDKLINMLVSDEKVDWFSRIKEGINKLINMVVSFS